MSEESTKVKVTKLDMLEDEKHRAEALKTRGDMITLKKLGYPIRNIQSSVSLIQIARAMNVIRSPDILIAEFGIAKTDPAELISRLTIDLQKEIIGNHIYTYPDGSKTLFIAFKE